MCFSKLLQLCVLSARTERSILVVPLQPSDGEDAPQPDRLPRRHAVRARRALQTGRRRWLRRRRWRRQGAQRGGRPLGRRLVQAPGTAPEAGEPAEAAASAQIHEEGIRERPADAEEGLEQLHTGARLVCSYNHQVHSPT